MKSCPSRRSRPKCQRVGRCRIYNDLSLISTVGTNQSLRLKIERLEQELEEAKEDAETANRKYSELLRYIVYTVPQLLAVVANQTGNPNLVRNMRQESDDAWDEAAAQAEGGHDVDTD